MTDYGPYLLQMQSVLPGKSQSPDGSLALISTLPYLNAKDSSVRSLALRTGLSI